MLNPHLLIYLPLIAIGFYFGKWLGVIGLVTIYFFFFHMQKLKKRTTNNSYKQQKNIDLTWAYKELGVSKHADIKAIKIARKKLINHYHPDKLERADKLEKQAAEQKVNAINRAYEAIKKNKSF